MCGGLLDADPSLYRLLPMVLPAVNAQTCGEICMNCYKLTAFPRTLISGSCSWTEAACCVAAAMLSRYLTRCVWPTHTLHRYRVYPAILNCVEEMKHLTGDVLTI